MADWEAISMAIEKGSRAGRELNLSVFWKRLEDEAQEAFRRAADEKIIRPERRLHLQRRYSDGSKKFVGMKASLSVIGQYGLPLHEKIIPIALPNEKSRFSRMALLAARSMGWSEEEYARSLREKALKDLFLWIGEADWRIEVDRVSGDPTREPEGLAALKERSMLSESAKKRELKASPKLGL